MIHVSVQVLQPMYGCDCYAYGLLAAGFCDLVVEADLKPYDYMALVAVVEGAGGVITDWQVWLFCSSLLCINACFSAVNLRTMSKQMLQQHRH